MRMNVDIPLSIRLDKNGEIHASVCWNTDKRVFEGCLVDDAT